MSWRCLECDTEHADGRRARAARGGLTCLPADLEVLADPTRRAWVRIRDVVPDSAYLAGGTGLAMHLQHRESDDLDFFLEDEVDLERLAEVLQEQGSLRVETLTEDTLNCYLVDAKLQFLRTRDARRVEPTTLIDGVRLAGVGDILAMKVLALAQRVPPEVKDYVDLFAIETVGKRGLEEGLALVMERYPHAEREGVPQQALRALCYYDDIRSQPMPRFIGKGITMAALERYWARRVREVVRHLSI
ncbi:MAG: nucleotidyl transferase AbiEii/AbiGii toxin family protein [Candidatus Dormibacteria bacterium]